MNIIFSTIIVTLIVITLFLIFAVFLNKLAWQQKEVFIEKTIEKVSEIFTIRFNDAMGRYKTGPWYLVVSTQGNSLPIWISNNNIRSVHPDLKNRKIIIKRFNGEDMVIENVENYELCPANELCDYDM